MRSDKLRLRNILKTVFTARWQKYLSLPRAVYSWFARPAKKLMQIIYIRVFSSGGNPLIPDEE